MLFLSETDDKIKIFIESKNDKTDLYLEGITLVADVKNANKRIYPKHILSEAINVHSKKFLETNSAVGELNHPTENMSQIDFNAVSHRFVSIKEEGNVFITKALILNTIKGKQVKNLHEGGVRLGISSRAFGNTKMKEDTTIVESLYIVSLGDIVANPSAPGAFLDAVMENKEFLWENGHLVEKDIQQELDTYKNIIENSTKKERTEIFKNIFNDYVRILKK